MVRLLPTSRLDPRTQLISHLVQEHVQLEGVLQEGVASCHWVLQLTVPGRREGGWRREGGGREEGGEGEGGREEGGRWEGGGSEVGGGREGEGGREGGREEEESETGGWRE